jgi:hypothetical protein
MDVGEAFQQRIGGLLRLVELAGVDCERTLATFRRKNTGCKPLI